MSIDLNLPDISESWKLAISRVMQAVIFGVLVVGLYEFNIGIIVNALFSLIISFAPAILERDYRTPAFLGITFWITVAVLMHAVGVLGPYDNIWWWDIVLHAFGSFLVASVGYSLVRAFKAHSREVELPSRFMAIFIFLFTMAIGVLWELVEYGAVVLAIQVGVEPMVTPNPLYDTFIDLVLDGIGAIVFALWGIFYFTNYSGRLKEIFDDWRGKKD